jgi:hypothetical protein
MPHRPLPVLKLYRIDVQLNATAYVKATSEQEALERAKKFIENEPFEFEGADISGVRYTNPNLPDISLSPAMSGVGVISKPELVEV